MREGRGRTPKSLQVHTHRHRHTLRGGLYPSAAPCSATPRDPPSPGPRPPYAAGPEAWGWSPQGGRRRMAEGWRGARRGPAPQAGIPPGPAHSGSERRWACEGASSRSCRISPPPFLILSQRAIGTATCAAPAGFGAGGGSPLCHSALTASRGNREGSSDRSGEADHRDLAPAKASGGFGGRRLPHSLPLAA